MKFNNLIARFLVNKTTQEEWNTLDSWKQESQENLTELLEMQTIWKESVDLKGYKQFDEKSAWDSISGNIEEDAVLPKSKVLNLRWIVGIAAAISIVVFSVFSLLPTNSDGFNTISANKLIEDVMLPDGSKIILNKHSELSYAAMFDANRNLVLDGEAYFDVARDESRPFTIETDYADITVLGTSFNIREHDDQVDIYVTSGKVKVVSGSEEVILTKNDMVSCKDGEIIKLKAPGTNYLSWKTGKLEFNDTPLHKVVMDLSKHYNKRISFSGDSKAMNKLVNDIFFEENFEDVLETIVLITGIKYHKDGAKYVIE